MVWILISSNLSIDECFSVNQWMQTIQFSTHSVQAVAETLQAPGHPNFVHHRYQRPVSILSKPEFFLRPIDARGLDVVVENRHAWLPIRIQRVTNV